MSEANKAIVRRYREAHSANTLDALDAIVAADLITHSQLPGLPPGREGGKLAHQAGVAAFPDLSTTTEFLVAEGDLVVERWTSGGTHTGAPFAGIAPSGKPFATTGISIYRVANGQIVEHWGEMDALGVMMQLGAMPAPPQAG